jgi:hypothetical protein
MKQRELQDEDNIRWQCVQAFSGVESSLSELAEAKSQNGSNTVTVVCTPSGGAQSVRITVGKDWEESVSDDHLLSAIKKEQKQ